MTGLGGELENMVEELYLVPNLDNNCPSGVEQVEPNHWFWRRLGKERIGAVGAANL